uniref:Uncharacterized protein n=1 Tax=viral metagenome TaxID=1070528 RepID=A0A6M3KUU8_9ZZZZ
MRMSKKQKLNNAEIYYTLLAMIASVEEVDEINIMQTLDIKSALARLEIGIKYRMLDLEATRRERDYLNGKK